MMIFNTVVCVSLLACVAQGSNAELAPDKFDALLLPEASGVQQFMLEIDIRADDLVDQTLLKTTDPRFAIGTAARERLWQLLAAATNDDGFASVWRQDQLDELVVALNSGNLQTQTAVSEALTFSVASLSTQARDALLARAVVEVDAVAYDSQLHALSKFRLPITQVQESDLLNFVLSPSTTNAALDQSVTDYDARLFLYGRSSFRERVVVSTAKVLIQSESSTAAAMQNLSPISAAHPEAVAEAMLWATARDGSVYSDATMQDREGWIAVTSAFLNLPESKALVVSGLRERAAYLYMSGSVSVPTVTSMLVSAYTSHSVSAEHLAEAAEMIAEQDSLSAVPVGWGD